MTQDKRFQRAHSEEQRAQRREDILDTTRSMLVDMRVASVSLNELARRTGLAKSNVLRYFESREAVLLELLDRESVQWLTELAGELAVVDDDPARGRERVASAIASTAAGRPILCDLLSSSAGVLEHNISPDVAARYKRSAVANAMRLADIVRAHVGGLSGTAAPLIVGTITLVVGSVWAASQPSPGMAAAYDENPDLAAMKLNFEVAVREVVATMLTGLAHRDPHLS